MSEQIIMNDPEALRRVYDRLNNRTPQSNDICSICRGRVYTFYVKGVERKTCDCGKIRKT